MHCHDCQNGLLELSYGLLEPAEAAEARAHAADCPACALALADAGKLQSLLGRAAKLGFIQTRFEAPQSEVAPRSSRLRATLSWSVAAVALVGVVGIPVYLNSEEKDSRPQYAAISTEKSKDEERPVVVVRGRDLVESGPGEWSGQTAVEAATKYRVIVLGPTVPSLGSEYLIAALDAEGKPLKVRVTVLVKADAVLAKKSFETDAKWTLAAEVWEKLPASGVKLHVLATHITSGDKVEVIVPLR